MVAIDASSLVYRWILGLAVYPMKFLHILLSDGFALKDQEILIIVLLSILGEVERAEEDCLPINNEDLMMHEVRIPIL